MSEPTRILHVFARMDCGGAELRALELMRFLSRRRYRFHFCVLSGRPGELDEEIRRRGGHVHLMRRGSLGFAGRFRRMLRRHRFQVVASHVLNYSGRILRLAAREGVPLRAAHFHTTRDGRGAGPARWIVRRWMRRWIDRYATHVVAVSRSAMGAVWGPRWQSDPRCRVIYNGLDPARFRDEADDGAVRREFGLDAQSPFYVHVGRMQPPKNHLRLLSVFAEVRRRRPAASLLLVGPADGSMERRVRRRAVELGIADRVVFCGQRDDVPRLLRAADAMIFPSRWEGLPGAVLEACAAGTPVLASDLPAVCEIAARLRCVRCLSLDANDAAWADVLEEIVAADTDVSRRQARRAFAASEFTVGRCAEGHCRIWEGSAPPAGRHAV